ncbi:MAG: Smr/MutS family protein [Myxococcales bacterium]
MGKKKKPRGPLPPPFGSSIEDAEEAEPKPVLPRAPERLASPFKQALSGLKKELDERAKAAQTKPKAPVPPPVARPIKRDKTLPEDDAMALSLAMQGVKRLDDKQAGRVSANAPKFASRTAQVVPFGESAEDQARARLQALVAQDVRFRIEGDRDFVSGSRIDADARVVRELRRRTRAAETLDLHGMNQRESREAVVSFIRRCHTKGIDIVCIVHGKGQHSEAGLGVLRDTAVKALTETGAAPLVRAFVTAPDVLGGAGALLVELKR